MSHTVLPIAGLGLLLGLRHAFEPDHLAAVSTLATCEGRLARVVGLGLAWALGHTASVGVVALAVIVMGWHLPETLSRGAELLVAVLLVLLGAPVVWRHTRGRWHIHAHRHDGARHLHLHSHARDASHAHAHPTWHARRGLGLGLAHGLAGSAAIVVLLVAAAPTTAVQLAYFTAFATGTMMGMGLVSGGLAVVVRLAARRGAAWATVLHVAAATASMVAGVVLGSRVLGGW